METMPLECLSNHSLACADTDTAVLTLGGREAPLSPLSMVLEQWPIVASPSARMLGFLFNFPSDSEPGEGFNFLSW